MSQKQRDGLMQQWFYSTLQSPTVIPEETKQMFGSSTFLLFFEPHLSVTSADTFFDSTSSTSVPCFSISTPLICSFYHSIINRTTPVIYLPYHYFSHAVSLPPQMVGGMCRHCCLCDLSCRRKLLLCKAVSTLLLHLECEDVSERIICG